MLRKSRTCYEVATRMLYEETAAAEFRLIRSRRRDRHGLYCNTGVVMIPGAPQLTAKDIGYRTNHSQAKCVFMDDTAAEKLDSVGACRRFSIAPRPLYATSGPRHQAVFNLYNYPDCSLLSGALMGVVRGQLPPPKSEVAPHCRQMKFLVSVTGHFR